MKSGREYPAVNAQAQIPQPAIGTKTGKLLFHLLDGNPITAAAAFQEYGIANLRAQIAELRRHMRLPISRMRDGRDTAYLLPHSQLCIQRKRCRWLTQRAQVHPFNCGRKTKCS
jgi:hypothetical protein